MAASLSSALTGIPAFGSGTSTLGSWTTHGLLVTGLPPATDRFWFPDPLVLWHLVLLDQGVIFCVKIIEESLIMRRSRLTRKDSKLKNR